MILKFLLTLCFLLLSANSAHARVNIVTCNEVRNENCTVSKLQADKDNPTFDFSVFQEQYYDYHYGYQQHKNSLKYLTFSESNLYQLPGNLFAQLPHISYLSAQNCSLDQITKTDFENASNLQKLLLSNNNISLIDHMVFWGCPKLLELNLASSQISNIQDTAFYNLGQLLELNLANNKLKTVKAEYFKDLKVLKFISLAQNQIESLDGDLFDNNLLLEIVRLNDNRIAIVGDAFLGKQNNLNFLYLQNNSIEQLNFSSINAKAMNLNDNKLSEVMINANNIRLFAGNNNISKVIVDSQAKITHLYLVNSNITDFSLISTISTLQYLDVSNNNIGRLNLTTFSALKNLLSLGLAYTKISNLEYGTFSHHPQLMKLDISYNSLGHIDLNIFTSLTSLEKLYLDGNDLTEIAYDDIKHSLPKLKTISLSDNNWNCTYLTAVLKKMNSVQVEIKIDATKFVSNVTNQKGIACNNSKAAHWKTPFIRFDPAAAGAINSSEILEMTKNIDKLIASLNTTEATDRLRNDIKQLQEKLQYLEKKLNEQSMTIVKTQLQVATANSTVQSQAMNDLHSIVEQLNNLTLQRQQLNNEILSQKLYETNFNVDRNAKSVDRLEAMLKLANNDNVNNKNYQQFYSQAGAQTGTDAGQISIWTVVLVVAMAVVLVICGFQAMTYLKKKRRRAMALSNRTSTATLEQCF